MTERTPKKAKSVVCIALGIATIKRLSSAEHAQRFHTLWTGVSEELAPTHVFFHEGRGGRRPISLASLRALESWMPLTGSPDREEVCVEMLHLAGR